MDYGGGIEKDFRIGDITSDYLEVSFGNGLRVRFTGTFEPFAWEKYADGEWVSIQSESGYDFNQGQHIRLEIHDDSRYVALLKQ